MTKSDKAYSKSKVMIGNLPNSLPLRNIREKFREFGKIVFMEPVKNGCYIKYATERSADDAIKEMHRRMCFDRYEKDLAPKPDGMIVSMSNREDSSELYYRFVCANISQKMDWKSLKNYFRKEFLNIPWDEITFCDIYDKPNEQGKRWGCIEYRSRSNAIIFLKEFYGVKIDGYRIQLEPLFFISQKEIDEDETLAKIIESVDEDKCKFEAEFDNVKTSAPLKRISPPTRRRSRSASPIPKWPLNGRSSKSPARRSNSRSPIRSATPVRDARLSISPTRKSRFSRESSSRSRSRSRSVSKSPIPKRRKVIQESTRSPSPPAVKSNASARSPSINRRIKNSLDVSMSWMEVGNQIEDGKWEITELTTKLDNGKRVKIVTFTELDGGKSTKKVKHPDWPSEKNLPPAHRTFNWPKRSVKPSIMDSMRVKERDSVKKLDSVKDRSEFVKESSYVEEFSSCGTPASPREPVRKVYLSQANSSHSLDKTDTISVAEILEDYDM